MQELDLTKIERTRNTAPSVTIAVNGQMTISKGADMLLRKKMSGKGPYVKVLWDPSNRSIGIEGAPSPKNTEKSPLLKLNESKEGQLQAGVAFLCNKLNYDYKGSGTQRFDVESKAHGRVEWILPRGKHPKAIEKEAAEAREEREAEGPVAATA